MTKNFDIFVLTNDKEVALDVRSILFIEVVRSPGLVTRSNGRAKLFMMVAGHIRYAEIWFRDLENLCHRINRSFEKIP